MLLSPCPASPLLPDVIETGDRDGQKSVTCNTIAIWPRMDLAIITHPTWPIATMFHGNFVLEQQRALARDGVVHTATAFRL